MDALTQIITLIVAVGFGGAVAFLLTKRRGGTTLPPETSSSDLREEAAARETRTADLPAVPVKVPERAATVREAAEEVIRDLDELDRQEQAELDRIRNLRSR